MKFNLHQAVPHFIMASLLWLPMAAFAHPGHDHFHTGFEAGFIHPFTGLDHMTMALTLGVLFYSINQRWNILGLVIMSVALMIGFNLGATQFIAANIAEVGIMASLLGMAVALWSKSKTVLPIAIAMLVMFHGAAHGVELAQAGHVLSLVSGMLVAMALIYALGLLFAHFVVKHLPYGKKVLGICAAMVALGFA